MKKVILKILSGLFLYVSVYGQSYKGQVDSTLLPVLYPHYESEYTWDKPTAPAAWNNQQGMHVAFGKEDELYFRAEVPSIKMKESKRILVGWKGQRVNTQILVWSADTLEQVHFKINSLKNKNGHIIHQKNINLHMVRYVLANYPYGANNVTCGNTPYTNGFLMPDRFENFERFDVPGKTLRPVWVSIDIPSSAGAGDYEGAIEVRAKGYVATLSLKVIVQSHVLPPAHDWKYRLDLWQNPWVVAWDNHVEPWRQEHLALLKKHIQLYADAGGKFITTYVVNSPWSDNSYSAEGAMVESVKRKNGSWKFDYTIFDIYVKLCMQAGIDKAITVYTPIPGGYRFRYMDEATGLYNYESWPPRSENFKTYWNAFLNDLRMHLQKNGWLSKTYIGINESPMDETLAAIKVVRENSKDWRITYAGDWHPELNNLLNDYSFLSGKESSSEIIKSRTAKGFTTTYYVCCNPAKPNNFLFSPPVEGRWISWYAAAYGYNGFLRWAYDAWPQDPRRDARHGSWAAGDCYLIYPGANSGIRFEKLREGIADYEKIFILKKLMLHTKDQKSIELMGLLDQLFTKINEEHTYNEEDLKTEIGQGVKLINELSGKLKEK